MAELHIQITCVCLQQKQDGAAFVNISMDILLITEPPSPLKLQCKHLSAYAIPVHIAGKASICIVDVYVTIINFNCISYILIFCFMII